LEPIPEKSAVQPKKSIKESSNTFFTCCACIGEQSM
jgi:hypothetical protein